MANFTTVFKTKNNSPIPTSIDNDPQKFLLGNSIIGDFNTTTTDGSGQGTLSSAEKNQTYFAYFNGIGGTGPEIIDQTAYFIKYLIDSQGNVITPQANSFALLNLNQNFEIGKTVNVTSLDGTTLFTTLLGNKTTTGIGKIETIAVTETGSGRMDYIHTMSFGASYLAVSSETAYNYYFEAKKAQSATINNTSYQKLDFGTEIDDTGNNYNPSTYIYTLPNNTSDQGTLLKFTARVDYKLENNADNGNTFYLQIWKNGSPIPLEGASPNSPTTKYYTVANPNDAGVVYTIYATSVATNFVTGDQIEVRYRLESDNNSANMKILALDGGYNTYFRSYQSYIATNYITSSYWSIGTWSTNPSTEYSVLTASKALTGLYSDQYTQLMPTASTAFGFSNITLPFQPQPGDFIRFEYDKNKTHTIYEIGTANTGSGTNISGSLTLKVKPGIQTGSLLDHFCIYRVIPNGNYLILDVKKPSGTTGQPLTGFIKPQYISEELENNFETIISKLNAEGTLS
jgi:hypothetical protein